MRIGVPKEIKDREHRVALAPEGARHLVERGHEVAVESGAGVGSGFADDAYLAAGVKLGTAAQAWDPDLVLKIKEPLEPEYGYLGRQILFTLPPPERRDPVSHRRAPRGGNHGDRLRD